MAYDIIGDIHGQADKLHALLSKLGYVQRQGAYRHPSRTASLLGTSSIAAPNRWTAS